MSTLRFRCVCILSGLAFLSISAPILGGEPPVPIGANDAFDAVANQIDPSTGLPATVALVDIRSRAEYYWVGVASQVDEIILKTGPRITPDLGKVRLTPRGDFLLFSVDGTGRRLPVERVERLRHAPMAVNIPCELWDEDTAMLVENPEFGNEMASLAQQGVQVVILYCRSGGRTSDCPSLFDTNQFSSVYEIDDPSGNGRFGGLEGNAYNHVYNGYRGFPQRQTGIQSVPSVAWKDAGLPIRTGLSPLSEE